MSFLKALSTIGEVVVSKFVDLLLEKVASVAFDFLKFPSDDQIQEGLQKLKRELQMIRELLDDAEERQLKDHSVKTLLSEIQNWAYDVDDIVDELETEASMRNLMERRGSSSKRRRLNFDAKWKREMMSKIEDATAKYKEFEPWINQLQLRVIGIQKSNVIEKRQPSTSLVVEPHVYGRDKDMQTICELVKSADEGNAVIAIVGMGGIGKTTLAQFVYNDASIEKHFHYRAWVCVSDDFDITRVTKDIYESIFSKPCDGKDLSSVQEELKKEFSEKNFLIVLDDVWNEDYHKWTMFQSPFLTRTPGSKIIVTTRSFVVSCTMHASYTHSLEVLSKDECLSVLAQHALGARDFERRPDLKEVAEKIARKCNGLPLAAKILGGLLGTDVDHDAWEKISESEIWELSYHHLPPDSKQFEIIPALHLSYHHLPPHLKRCFAYCSILPKDYEFEEKNMILLWRAEGFLQAARDKHSIEDLGHKYFRDLLSRSLLQRSSKDESRFVMHDLINDLAQSVARDICFRIEGDQKFSKHTRHLSYISGEFEGIKKFRGISEAQHLRTFLPLRLLNVWHLASYVTNDVLMNLLQNFRWLRVLSLEGYQVIELPDFIGDFKHLRYLNFSRTLIKCLPESISTLFNLETLLLRECWRLERLPLEMENLVNLCHLDIIGAKRLKGMPWNFSALSALQTLSYFVLQEGKGCQITELANLSNLKGELCISGLENVVETQDARKAKLQDKPRLDKLKLEWCKDFENRSAEMEKNVFDLLQPSKKLKELALKYYCGVRLGEWIGDSSFNKLISLRLEDCPNCIELPSLGQLPSLKKLCIKGLDSVTNVGVKFYGKNTSNIAFPSLESLKFENMLKWKEWNFVEVDWEPRNFPRLCELFIVRCSELLGSIPEYLPTLEKLVIRECEKLEISIQSLPMLSILNIARCRKVECKGFVDGNSLKRIYFKKIPKFTWAAEWLSTSGSINVESLEIEDCEELCSLRENNWELLTQPISLGTLSIRQLPQIISLGVKEEREELMQLKIPSSIQHLRIEVCERLEKLSASLHYVTSLCVLNLWSCPKLISLSKNNLPLNLKTLEIHDCENLMCLLEEEENGNIGNACLLEHLTIKNCPNLVSLSSRGELPTSFKCLTIEDCEKLESMAQEIQDNSSLEYVCISFCKNFSYLPQGFNKLNHLQEILIWNCSNLVSFLECDLPTSSLKVLRLSSCEKLQALPDGILNLNSLQQLCICDCSSVRSFPEAGIPTTLRKLEIQGPNICKPLIEWGLHRLTSLQYLCISNGCPDAVSFPQDEIGMTLPSSLTDLEIWNFPKLEILSSKGFQDLTSLEFLLIGDCPSLKSLPEKDMLLSLLLLHIWKCPVLIERCEVDKGLEWSKIAHIPCVRINGRYNYESD